MKYLFSEALHLHNPFSWRPLNKLYGFIQDGLYLQPSHLSESMLVIFGSRQVESSKFSVDWLYLPFKCHLWLYWILIPIILCTPTLCPLNGRDIWCVLNVLFAQLCPTLPPPWTVAHQTPLSMGILQARTLEWVAVPSCSGSSPPRDQTCISCIGRQILYRWAIWEALCWIPYFSLCSHESSGW